MNELEKTKLKYKINILDMMLDDINLEQKYINVKMNEFEKFLEITINDFNNWIGGEDND